MKNKVFFAAALVACSGLVIGLLKPLSTSATVPGINEGVDVNTSGGSPNSNSWEAGPSQNGRYVVFESRATNLVSPATNGDYQIFVRDRLNNTTTLVSVSSGGTQGNGDSIDPRISADGRYVVFDSSATNLVSGDTNGDIDVFIHDMSTGTTQIVSKNSSGTEGNNASQSPSVDADGNYVIFQSYATNLVSSPSTSGGNIFLKNISTGAVTLLSQNSSGTDANADSFTPDISCEGRIAIFNSYANNLVSGDSNNPSKNLSRIYVVDLLQTVNPVYITGSANASFSQGLISCNGNYIGFTSTASNIVSGDTNSAQDAFVYDRINNTFERVSVSSSGTQANGASTGPASPSNDGRYVVFESSATNLVSGDTNATDDIFLRNREAGTTELVTQNSGGTISNGFSFSPMISADGRYVAYTSEATNLVTSFGYSGGASYTSETGTTDAY